MRIRGSRRGTLSEVRTRPTELSDDDVAAAVGDHWGLEVTAATYRPVGFGSHHWAVGSGDGPTWFVTVDDLAARRWSRTEPLHATFDRLAAALGAARQLADQGLTFVVAPERSSRGKVLVRLDERFAIAVHRHVDGAAQDYGDVRPLADRLAMVELVAQVHGASVRGAQREDLVPAMHDELLAALADLGRPWHGGPFAEQARHVLREAEGRITAALDEHRRLAALTLDRPDRFVLTHGEPHPGNTMTTAAGLVLVDWDTALVAPPERDLWMLADGPGDRTVLDAYTRRTGVAVDDVALRTYRLHWDLTDVALYTDLLRHPHEDTDDVRESFANLRALVAAADVDGRTPARVET